MNKLFLSIAFAAAPFVLQAQSDAQPKSATTVAPVKKTAAASTVKANGTASASMKESLQQPATSEESPLVRAAKAGSAHRKGTRKVITNADIRTSKGNVSVVPTGTPSVEPPLTDAQVSAKIAAAVKAEADNAADNHIARIRAEQRVLEAQKRVDSITKDMTQLEQRYYEESDPEYRDNVLEKKFNDSRKQLDDAKKELDNARSAQQTLPRS